MTARHPSTDLYFVHACDDRIARWWRRGPVRAIGANSFVAGDTLLMIRRDDDAVMRQALDWRGRFVYVVDDDIAGAATSACLPDDYRRRLAAFETAFHRPLLARADQLLVSSQPLAERLGPRPVRRIDPYWRLPCADQHHFATLARGGSLDIVHLGSGSHAGAFAALAPAIADLLRSRDDVTFTYVGREPPHPALAAHPRVRRVPPMSWPRYRRWLGRRRFHLALYPLAATPFDRARSTNKLLEHAIVGAVGIYPADWAPADAVGGGALRAPADPAAWCDALVDAVARRGDLALVAAEAARALTAHGKRAMQRRLWDEILGLGSH